jgi:succinate-semialdehyde dehydrogenase / glutarate-semialdehyde dehydrogenase
MYTRMLIDGEWRDAHSGAVFAVTDPATDALVAQVPNGDARDAHAAIAAASRAYDGWRALTGEERSGKLRRLAALMLERRHDLARLLTTEQGKPLEEARAEVSYAASFIDWAADEARRIYGDLVPASSAGQRILVLRQPVGVVACITPWNFPAAMVTRKLGPALAAGCTVVLKPAEQTPLTALEIGAYALEAGIPAGVFNVITGDPAPIAAELFSDPVVRKLSFTGSTDVGRILVSASARNLTRLSLELGGHAPFIVFDDADVPRAVAGALASKIRNGGQTCIASNRFFVQAAVYDEFVGGLTEALERLRLGPGLEEGVDMGPLIDDPAVRKVDEHIEDALERGATLRTGGRRVRPRPGLADRFYLPTVLEGMTREMLVAREETFGPVCPIRRFDREEEVIELANASPYGLAAYFYTRDASRLMRVAERLEYGIVGANDGAPSTPQAPFGGIKQSGWGREGGKYAMDAYTELKYVSWRI